MDWMEGEDSTKKNNERKKRSPFLIKEVRYCLFLFIGKERGNRLDEVEGNE